MSLFRKQPTSGPVAVPTSVVSERESQPVQAGAPPQQQTLFTGGRVELEAVYRAGRLTADELDRVSRAEGLLHLLPRTATNTREVVDATFRAFGVDRSRIIDAATKQQQTLEAFIRYSQEQTQRVLDVAEQRIAELQAEIERCRQTASQATNEGEERARAINAEMVKVQRVIEFFGDEGEGLSDVELEDAGGDTVKPQPAQSAARPK
jgi:hypothetical protein